MRITYRTIGLMLQAVMNRYLSKAVTLVALVGLALASSGLAAHEGHDHGAPPTPVSTTIAPRVDASSTTFELIAVFRKDALMIFVDRFATNEPVIPKAL